MWRDSPFIVVRREELVIAKKFAYQIAWDFAAIEHSSISEEQVVLADLKAPHNILQMWRTAGRPG